MRTFTKFAAALAVAVPLIAATGTAQARETTTASWSITIGSGYTEARYGHNHGYGHRYRIMPPQVVRKQLQRSYYNVSRLDRRGDVYIARAEDRRGRDIRITADVYTGRVIDVDYLRRDRNDRRDHHHNPGRGRR